MKPTETQKGKSATQNVESKQSKYLNDKDKQDLLKILTRSLLPLKIIRNIFVLVTIVTLVLPLILIKSKPTALIVCIFWTAIALSIVFITNRYYKRNTNLKKQLLEQPVPVQRISGVVTLRNMGESLYAVNINGMDMPQVVGTALIYKYKDQQLTFEYLPTLKLNKSFHDVNGNGYDFLKRDIFKQSD